MRILVALGMVVAIGSTSMAEVGQSPRVYVKRDTWAETVTDSRAAYAQWWQEQLGAVRLGPWHTTERNDKFSPRDVVDLTKWQVRRDLPDGFVHCDLSNHGINLQRRLPPSEDSETTTEVQDDGRGPAFLYQVRTIVAEKPVTVTARLGAEYGLELWLDGRRVYSNARLGNGLAPEPDQAEVELPLTAGRHQLILRIVDVRRSGFYFSLVPRDRDPIENLLEQLDRDFPTSTRRMLGDALRERLISWFRDPDDTTLPTLLVQRAIDGLGDHNRALQAELKKSLIEQVRSDRTDAILGLYAQASRFRKAWADLALIDFAAMRRAIDDLSGSFPERYPHSEETLRRLAECETRLPTLRRAMEEGRVEAIREVDRLVTLRRDTLLANPLLDFDRLLLIRRKPIGDPRRRKGPNRGMGEFFGLPQQSAWQLDRIRQPYGWENEIAVLSSLRDDATIETLYRPPMPRLISDIDLHFDARKLLFSMPGSHHVWQVFEVDADGRNSRQVSVGDQSDAQNFDGCYLPNDEIVFVSTAVKQGVPCSDGIAVAMNYVMDGDGRNVRQLCFDQDHDYCPTVMNDGRVLYLRWDYTDLPHQWPRILFTMNPDGTGQREYYGSNSYWPNAIFFARPIPGHPTKIAGIVTGHHVGRIGELVIFDPALGRQEADGVVQRIPGYGQKVEPIIMDKLTIDSWPKFTHPFPLSEKYFLVACKPGPDDLWGIYLADVFDNLVLIKEIEGYALFEPTPFRPTLRPPVIPSKVDPSQRDAIVYLEDIYQGPGLKGVPRGTVKRLRVFAYHFAYPYKTGGQHRVGTDGPWEPKRILGTVPVEADGSAAFRVPAKMPISIQAIDANHRAVQLMRSWTTAMPGEIVSCVGCHEHQNAGPPSRATIAATRKPSTIEPWHGPLRGFSFPREVQPVLDRHCVSCHDGSDRPDGQSIADLRGDRDAMVVIASNDPKPRLIRGVPREELVRKYSGVFEPAYFELRRFVRVGGLESDLHVLPPGEFAADTTELVQMIEKGHHGVRLDAESWDRLATWIDLNAPCHGTWREILGLQQTQSDHARRHELQRLYGGVDDDPERIPERIPDPAEEVSTAVTPRPITPSDRVDIECPDWPFDPAEARRRQSAGSDEAHRRIDLGDGVSLELALIPSGEFLMGDTPARVKIAEPFWMGRFEITNEQFARFDPTHDSRHEHGTASFNSRRAIGPPLNGPKQPVVRISWQQATAFCRWASKQTGWKVTLPSESQWEYACRAGTAGEFYYGDRDTDFSPFANMADATINRWATYNESRRSADQVPRDARFDDGSLVTAEVGSYRANAWGLHDMHGNVWEWTRSTYEPSLYAADLDAAADSDRRTIRGGSWYDRPKRCGSASRLGYPTWRRVYNVGFRVVCEK